MYMDIINDINNDVDILKRLVILSEFKGKEGLYNYKLSNKIKLKNNTLKNNFKYLTKIIYDDKFYYYEDSFKKTILNRTSNDEDKNSLELRIEKLLKLIHNSYDMFKLDFYTLLNFHQNTFDYKSDTAGKFKYFQMTILRDINDNKIYKQETVSPTFIDLYLNKIFNGLNTSSNNSYLKSIIMFVDLHIIQPFYESNDLISLIFLSFLLLKEDIHFLRYSSIFKKIFYNLHKFMNELDSTFVGYNKKNYNLEDIKPFILLMINIMIECYEEIDVLMNKSSNTSYDKKSEIIKIANEFKTPFSINDIISKLDIIVNRQTINRIIKSCVDSGKLIKIGDKKKTKYKNIINN